MTRLLFDIEADGFLETVTKVHCIGIIDVDTGEQASYGPDRLQEALDRLYEADEIIFHNGIRYDLPVLRKVLGWHPRPGCRRTDTLVIARLIHADQKRLRQEDIRRGFTGKLVGAQSLKAWGLRLGEPKADYEGGWDEWSQEMQAYMDQDVRTNLRLLRFLKPWEYPQVPLDLEHRVAELCWRMEEAGMPFSKNGAVNLFQKLVERRDVLERELVAKYGSWEVEVKRDISKVNNSKLGRVKGREYVVTKTVVFNPGSRQHIEKVLRQYGWEPDEFTDSGRAKLNEPTLLKLAKDFPEAKLIVEYLLVQKRLGALDGKNGWLHAIDDQGLVHPSYHPNGTNTGRATHYDPNVSQVPSVRKPYGADFRSLFTVPHGWRLVGADQSGLELRCLAHYLAFWDWGKYAAIVVDGDVHWFHATEVFEFMPPGTVRDKGDPKHKDARDEKGKRTTYAILYGAHFPKIGSISGGNANKGRRLKNAMMRRIPGFGQLAAHITEAVAKRGCIKGLDGRIMPVRSPHAALNMLLQNAGAVICKTWMVNAVDRMEAEGLRFGWDGDFVLCIWAHDELQVACREEHTETVARILVEEAQRAGDAYSFKCRLDGEATVGDNWASTH